jgi:hypothetical protein
MLGRRLTQARAAGAEAIDRVASARSFFPIGLVDGAHRATAFLALAMYGCRADAIDRVASARSFFPIGLVDGPHRATAFLALAMYGCRADAIAAFICSAFGSTSQRG